MYDRMEKGWTVHVRMDKLVHRDWPLACPPWRTPAEPVSILLHSPETGPPARVAECKLGSGRTETCSK